jgi:hypothetical protein
VLVLDSSKLFLASDLGFTGIPESGFRGLGFGVWIWVSGFRGVWGLVLHRRLRWFARGLLVRRRTTPKGDSPGGGFSPGGGHSTTDVQSKAVDQGIFWVFRVFRVFRVCLVLHPGHRSGLPFFLHPRHRWIEAGNRCLAARVTHQRMDQVLCAVLCPTAEAPPPEEGCRFGWSRSRARCPKDGFPLARRRSEPLSDHSGKSVGHEKDDS